MKKYLALSIISIFVYMFLVIPISAQSNLDLTVYPAVVEHEVQPNTPSRFLLQFRNNNAVPISGKIKVADYIIADKQGTPLLVEDKQVSLKYAASKWISPLVGEITIPAHDYAAINISVNPPQEMGACGHYSIVYFEPFEKDQTEEGQQNTQSESSVVNKIGALVNLKTKSKTCKQDLSVLGFSAPQFLEYGPIKVSFDLFNKGDVHINPQGSVTATNMMDKTVSSTPIKEQRIFPETAKTYESMIGQRYMIGKYAVRLQGTYGDSMLPFTATLFVWVFPWKIAIAILLMIIILFLVGKKIHMEIKGKELTLEQEIAKDRKEIEKLKDELKKRD